jgi:hypothetical protein
MKCCAHCFNDKEVIGFIFSNSTEKGNCDFCESTNVDVINCQELDELFQPVISVFSPVDDLHAAGLGNRLLHEKMQDLWNIFQIPSEKAKHLLTAIFSTSIDPGNPILNLPVTIKTSVDPSQAVELHQQKWENFATEIKYSNRFFLKETIDLDLLSELLRNFTKRYDKGKLFYRARISEKDGFTVSDMGKPPKERATGGRANPIGIPYLYVTTKVETAIYESRPSFLDYVSVAELKLIEPLSVVTLREITSASPFVFGDRLEYYLLHQKYLSRLEEELSRPVRKVDKELDYLPSQYLCEFVKSLGYNAIEYGSSLHQGGINLAVFNEDKFNIKGVEVFEIAQVTLAFKKLSP